MTEHFCQLAGGKFRPTATQAITRALPNGTKLSLLPEPNNSHDENAVKVIATDDEGAEAFIGYVPKNIAAQISDDLQSGAEYECVITGLNDLQPELHISVEGEELIEDEYDEFFDEE